jgi:hypothetical protein
MTDAELDAALLNERRIAELEASLKGPGKLEKTVSEGLETAKNVGGFLKESGKSMARGFTTSIANLMEKGMPYNPLMLALQAGNRGKPLSQTAQQAFPKRENQSPRETLWDRAMEGAGGALMLPAGGLGTAALSGAMGGVGAEIGGRLAAPAGKAAEIAGDVLGGVLGGGLTGFAIGPKQSVGQADIREALSGMKPRDFQQAEKTLADFRDVGARTGTAAEAFGGNSAPLALAEKSRAGAPNNPLREMTKDREADLKGLGREFIRRIGPKAEPNTVNNQTVDAANAYLAQMKSGASDALGQRFQGVNL